METERRQSFREGLQAFPLAAHRGPAGWERRIIERRLRRKEREESREGRLAKKISLPPFDSLNSLSPFLALRKQRSEGTEKRNERILQRDSLLPSPLSPLF